MLQGSNYAYRDCEVRSISLLLQCQRNLILQFSWYKTLHKTQMYFFFFRSRFRKLHEKSDFNKIENAKIYVYFIKENLSVFTSCLHRLRLFLLLRKIFLCLEHVSLCLVYYSNKRKNRSPSFLNKWKKWITES